MAVLIDRLEDDLLACLCESLVQAGRPVCACHKYHGEQSPPADRCSRDGEANGMAWLHRGDISWSPGSGSSARTWSSRFCGGASRWTVEIDLGIRRCITAIQQGEHPPPPEDYDVDRAMADVDQQILLGLLCCDVWDATDPGPGFAIVSSQLRPVGPLGGCAGSTLTLVVEGDVRAMTNDVEDVVLVSGPAGSLWLSPTSKSTWMWSIRSLMFMKCRVWSM